MVCCADYCCDIPLSIAFDFCPGVSLLAAIVCVDGAMGLSVWDWGAIGFLLRYRGIVWVVV